MNGSSVIQPASSHVLPDAPVAGNWTMLRRLVPPALPPDPLPDVLRWQLVGSLFAQKRSLVEGSLALTFIALVCWARLGSLWFAAWAASALAVLLLRQRLTASYERNIGTGTPDEWARKFAIGAGATALVWGIGSMMVTLRVHDIAAVLLVVTVEAGWVSGAAARNNISPATSVCQIIGPLLPAAAGFFISGQPFYQALGLMIIIQISANLSIARYLGKQTLNLLVAQQKQVELHTKLSTACEELEDANSRLQRLSATDGLTGIANRRAFDAALQTEWSRAIRDNAALSLMMLDVDAFKSYNDHYGHPAGDDCLRLIAQTLEAALRRPPDFAARFGGEEFVALLPGTERLGAIEAAERVREHVLNLAVAHQACASGVVTISIGIATARPDSGADSQRLIAAADQALYRAKQEGRNAVRAQEPA